jgi:hypothetical protein
MSTDEGVRTLATDAAGDEEVEAGAPVTTGASGAAVTSTGTAGARRRGTRRRSRHAADPSTAADEGSDASDVQEPRFWHRDHPVFTPLAGFFTGVASVVVVLGLLGAILDLVLGYDVSAHPWIFLVALGVLLTIDLALVVAPGTRRFARYLLFGILTTPAVVLAAATFTTWLLLR